MVVGRGFRTVGTTVLLAASALAADIHRQEWAVGQALRFELRRSSDSGDCYVARGRNYALRLDRNGATMLLNDPDRKLTASLAMQLVDARASVAPEALDRLSSISNYLIGNLESARVTGVAHTSRVRYPKVFNGIDLVYYGNEGQLEYDFVVQPGADPASIRLQINGAQKLSVSDDGDLVMLTQAGQVKWNKPYVYQKIEGVSRRIEGHFHLFSANQVAFQVADYDRKRDLVIDPALSYATYLGGSQNEAARGIALDAAGNVYVTGYSTSPDLPVTRGAFQTAYAGNTASQITGDAFVAKYTPSGTLVYITYIGGSGDDISTGIAVDAAGNAYLTGYTNSTNFPTTPGAFQKAFAGSGGNQSTRLGDAFVTKLSPDGNQLLYSTFLGGKADDVAFSIAIDGAGSAYITGATLSMDFPITAGAYQTTSHGSGGQPILRFGYSFFISGDVFVSKLDAAGAKLIYSTYLGGSRDEAAFGITVDSSGNAFVGGYTISPDFPTTSGAFQRNGRGSDPDNPFFHMGDAFLTKFNPTGGLSYSTLVGGTGDEWITAIAVDGSGNAYATGSTTSTDFPVTAGVFQSSYRPLTVFNPDADEALGDAFLLKMNPAGSGLVFATYLGGSGDDVASSVMLDSAGNIFLGGQTNSPNFPVTPDAAQRAYAGGGFQTSGQTFGDGFLTVLNPTATSLVYSTYLGGTFDDSIRGMALSATGVAYVAGSTASRNFPATANAAQPTYGGSSSTGRLRGDAFIAAFSGFASAAPAISAIVNAASNVAGTVSPGMIFLAYGSLIGPKTLVGNSLNAAGLLDFMQAGTRILFDGVPAPIVYVSQGQSSGIVPYSVAGKTTTQVVVQMNGQSSAPFTVKVADANPGLFSVNFSGTGPGAILNEDGSPNSPANPAKAGSTFVLFGTGEGQTIPVGVDGRINLDVFPKPALPVSVTLGDPAKTGPSDPPMRDVPILYAGAAPQLVSGLFQVNAQLPTDAPSGNQQITVKVGSFSSRPGLTVAIQ